MLTRTHIHRLSLLMEEYDHELRVKQGEAQALRDDLARINAAISQLGNTYADKLDRAAPGWRAHVMDNLFESIEETPNVQTRETRNATA